MSEKHPEFKSERREKARDRARFQMRTGGRPEYLLLRVGGLLRKTAGLDRHEKMGKHMKKERRNGPH